MGTKATIRLIYKGIKKTWYIQFDGDTLGAMLVRDLKLLLAAFGGDISMLHTMVSNLKLVNAARSPTPEQIELLRQFADLRVSQQSYEDWYCLLRKCQDSLINTLVAGYIVDVRKAREEYNWVIDFDTNQFYYNDSLRFDLANIPADWVEQCNRHNEGSSPDASAAASSASSSPSSSPRASSAASSAAAAAAIPDTAQI